MNELTWSDQERVNYISCLLGQPVDTLERIGSGRNSRVYKVEREGSCPFIAKFYFTHSDDKRRRLFTEYNAFQFLRENSILCVPEPLIADEKEGCAIYGYVKGSPISPGSASGDDIKQVLALLEKLRTISDRGKHFTDASEACFSPMSLEKNIEERIERLAAIQVKREEERQVVLFLQSDFSPALIDIVTWSKNKAKLSGFRWGAEIEKGKRTLSPSDVGFHNSLRKEDGEIVFLDFEYFGWDNPAKTVSDFILHPAMNLPGPLCTQYFKGMMKAFATFYDLEKYIEIFYPLIGLKWCLILLNEFIPSQRVRRNFAHGTHIDESNLLISQIEKSKAMLERIKREYADFPYK